MTWNKRPQPILIITGDVVKESHCFYKKSEKQQKLKMSNDDDKNNNQNQPPNVISFQSVKNEKKRSQEPTRRGSKKKTPADKNNDERFWKLIEVIEEQQHRIQRLEENFIRLVRLLKKMGDASAQERPTPPPTDA